MSNRLKELRERMGYSRPAFAKECQVAIVTIWRWEQGVADALRP
jgi:transcriptional regulator with XRE-family HTH domain